jgi:uncharacterized membrane protein YjfL (UPF0719 family)
MDPLLGLSVPLAIVLWGRWYYSLRLGRTLRASRQGRKALALVPVFCAIFLFAILKRLSANNVKSDSTTVVLYLMFGASWLGLTQMVFGLLGVSARDDVLERGNPSAAWVISGQLIGAAFCFAGANIGNGPGPEVVVLCAFLATFALLLLWFLIDRAASLTDTITIDRNVGIGIRLCGWLVADGIVLGDAVTGNWRSATATARDFVGCAWPAAAFAVLVAFLERKLRTLGPDHPWNSARSSMILAVVYVVCATGYAWKRGIH